MIELNALLDWAIGDWAIGDWAPVDGWRRLALDIAWQTTLIGLLAAGLLSVCRRRPALRAAITLVAAGLFVAAPLSTALARYYGWGMLAAPAAPLAEKHDADVLLSGVQIQATAIQLPAGVTTEWPAPKTTNATNTSATTNRIDVAWRVAATVWLLLTLGLALRLVRSALGVRHLYNTAIPCTDSALLATLEQASRTLGVAAPMLCTSPAVRSPALVSWGPTRLLLAEGHSAINDWQAVFCHELAHIARRDGQSRVAMELLVTLLPWQPLAWLLRREFRVACEQACDDWSVAAGADPVELAALLADFIPQRQPPLVLGMSENAPATRNRILRLLAMQSSPQPQLGRALAVSGWLVAIILLIMLMLSQRGGPGRVPTGGGSGGGVGLPPWGDAPIATAAAGVRIPAEPYPRKAYLVQPPDVLLINAVKIVPKPPYKLATQDVVKVDVLGTMPDQPISGSLIVSDDGKINLGFSYGSVKVVSLTIDEAQQAITERLKETLAQPKVSLSLGRSSGQQKIAGEYVIGPDGDVNLGTYGSVYVNGMTVPEVRAAIEKHLSEFLDSPQIAVAVQAYNSLVYYVVLEGVDGGDFVIRSPWTGAERVLDSLAQSSISGQKISLADCWIWIGRPGAKGDSKEPDAKSAAEQILPVDWQAIVNGGDTWTNWAIQPGDRIVIRRRGSGPK